MINIKTLYNVAFGFFMYAACVHATLGEVMEPQLGATAKTSDGYTQREIARDDGGRLREYAGSDGVVFGVYWEGGRLPNLEKVLGKHFKPFVQEAHLRRERRGPLYVEVGDLIVVSGGHQRDFRGRAFVKSLIPSHLSHEVVR